MKIGDIAKFEIWLANLNPQRGTEIGKVRPVLVVQSDLFVTESDSTIVCPITSKGVGSSILKVKLEIFEGTGLKKESWIVLDQLRSIDNRRLIQKIGSIDNDLRSKVNENLKIVLDLT